MKFSVKDFLVNVNKSVDNLRIHSYLPKKCLMENFIFCSVVTNNDNVGYINK